MAHSCEGFSTYIPCVSILHGLNINYYELRKEHRREGVLIKKKTSFAVLSHLSDFYLAWHHFGFSFGYSECDLIALNSQTHERKKAKKDEIRASAKYILIKHF